MNMMMASELCSPYAMCSENAHISHPLGFSSSMCNVKLFFLGIRTSHAFHTFFLTKLTVGRSVRLKEQFDCDLKLLKCAQLAREVGEDQSVVDIIEPNLWTSCNIEKGLHKLILAKGIFALDM